MRPAQDVLDESEGHADRGGAEAEVPGDLLPQRADHQRGEERAEVDAHVEDGEAGVPARVLVLAVQVPDERGDVRLEQPRARDDEAEPEVDEGSTAGQRQRDVPQHDHHAAVQDRQARAQHPVADPAAGQRHQVHHGRVDAHQRLGRALPQAQPAARRRRGEEQHQDAPHAVEAEALPHLGEEQRREPAWMAEETPFRPGTRRRCGHAVSPVSPQRPCDVCRTPLRCR
jgi:hypothetical protein